MRTKIDEAIGTVAIHRLERPDLLLLERRPVGIDLEAERLGGEIPELAVDQADGPAALLLVLCDYVTAADAAAVHAVTAVAVVIVAAVVVMVVSINAIHRVSVTVKLHRVTVI